MATAADVLTGGARWACEVADAVEFVRSLPDDSVDLDRAHCLFQVQVNVLFLDSHDSVSTTGVECVSAAVDGYLFRSAVPVVAVNFHDCATARYVEINEAHAEVNLRLVGDPLGAHPFGRHPLGLGVSPSPVAPKGAERPFPVFLTIRLVVELFVADRARLCHAPASADVTARLRAVPPAVVGNQSRLNLELLPTLVAVHRRLLLVEGGPATDGAEMPGGFASQDTLVSAVRRPALVADDINPLGTIRASPIAQPRTENFLTLAS